MSWTLHRHLESTLKMHSFSTKVVLVLFLGACVQCQDAPVVSNNVIPPEMANSQSVWQQQLRQAVAGASTRLQTNLVVVLNSLVNTTESAGQNVTLAIATLTRAVVTNTFDLAGVISYLPKLLLADLPTQFVEVLQLIRRNEIRAIPTDVNGAIDSILAMTRLAEESGITRQLFDPIARFLPNMLAGIHGFLQTIIGTTANVFGAGVYRYDPTVDNEINERTSARIYYKI